jgi:FkbM family methyltransferase
MGLWTLRMAERVGPAGRVIAFEPGPVTGTRLRDNIALSGARQVVVHGLALGAEPGELVLHTPRDSGSASLGAPDEPATQSRVRVERLDKIWQAAGSPRVALVKMDVEGAEPMVLAGASAFFSATRPVVCCEINPTALRRLGFGPGDVLGFFHQRGYCAMIWHAATQRLQPHAAQPDADAVEDVVFLPQESRLATAQPGART